MGAVASIISGLAAPAKAQYAGPLGVIFGVAALWSFVLNPAIMACRLWRFPLAALLILLAVVIGGWDGNDNHHVRVIERLQPLAGAASGADTGHRPATIHAPPLAQDDLRRWLAGRGTAYERGRNYPVFVVAAEGGGIRNAYWTAAVLCSLHDDKELDFKKHLYAISGVSGGSVGGTVYAALVRDQEQGFAKGDLLPYAQQILAEDLLSPLLARALTWDVAQQFLPRLLKRFDRATALERSLEQAWKKRVSGSQVMTSGFSALRDPHVKGSNVPALLLNTTDVSDGRTYPISHIDPGLPPRKGLNDSMPLLTFQADVLGDRDLPLSTAAFLSSRFPLVTPAGSIDVKGTKRRFVDGGYFENSGASTLLELIQSLAQPDEQAATIAGSNETASLADVEIHVILIDFSEPKARPAILAFGDPLSPLITVLATRDGRGATSVARLERYLQDIQGQQRTSGIRLSPSVTRISMPSDIAPLPLGWSLSATARQALDTQLRSPRGAAQNTPANLIKAALIETKLENAR